MFVEFVAEIVTFIKMKWEVYKYKVVFRHTVSDNIGEENFYSTVPKKGLSVSLFFGSLFYLIQSMMKENRAGKIGKVGTGEKSRVRRVECPKCKQIQRLRIEKQRCSKCREYFYLFDN